MHSFSTLPLILAAQIAFWCWLALSMFRKGLLRATDLVVLGFWLALLCLWGFLTAQWAMDGSFRSGSFYALLPALWLPAVPIAATTLFALVSPLGRVLIAIGRENPRAFVVLQALRVAAIGGLVKAYLGLMPALFTVIVGVPDLLFGLSALFLLLGWPKDGWPARGLMVWNIMGFLIIFLAGPLLIQLGLPGPLHVITSQPDGRALLEFPMVWAPMVVVPVFMIMNAIQVIATWQDRTAAQQQLPSAATPRAI